MVSNALEMLIYVSKSAGLTMAFTVGRAREVAYLIGVLVVVSVLTAPVAQAQEQATATEQTPTPRGTNLSFGGLKVSSDLPVQVVSDELEMDQNIDTAVFAGRVEVEQGDLKLNSAKVLVEYGTTEGSTQSKKIIRMTASGDVIMISPTETAEADKAVYTVATSEIVMTGDVVVTQGPNRVAGERMVVNLDDGTAVMVGRVRTFIDTSKSKDPDPAASDTAPTNDTSQ